MSVKWWHWLISPTRANRAWEQELEDEGVFLRVVGWGPFPIPGEKKRLIQAHRDAIALVEVLRQIEDRQE